MPTSLDKKEGEIYYLEADPNQVNNDTLHKFIPKCPRGVTLEVLGRNFNDQMIIVLKILPRFTDNIEKILGDVLKISNHENGKVFSSGNHEIIKDNLERVKESRKTTEQPYSDD